MGQTDDSGRSLWSALRDSLSGRSEPEAPELPPLPPAWVPLAMVYVDGEHRVVSANPAAIELLGVPEEALTGEPLARWVPTVDTLASRRPTRKAGGLWVHELEVHRGDGTLLPVEVSEAVVPEHDELVAVSLADLSARHKQLRRLSRANERLTAARDESMEQSRAKTLTMARVAEVLRTPLSAIIGYGELLVEEAQERGEDEMLSDIERILESSGALLSILKNVLDLAEIEAGRMSVLQNRLDIGQELQSVLDAHRAIARQRGNTLSFVRTAQVGDAYADRERVVQVLDNLLDNANRYCEGATITVQVRREPVGDEERIVIEVADTGPGIPDDKLKGLFHQYGRSGTARGATGAGIGLVVSAALAKLMEGSLTATSREGYGSTFVLTLPAFTVQHEIHPPMLTATGLPAPRRVSQATVRAAIRDDALRVAAVSALQRGGWPVDLVDHDPAAFEGASGDGGLVVVDGGGDYALLESLRGSAGPRMPVLLLLGEPVSADERRSLEKLATVVVELSSSAGSRAWDAALPGAVTRAVMMGAMQKRLGPMRPSIAPASVPADEA